jgi:rhomboid protease GluP
MDQRLLALPLMIAAAVQVTALLRASPRWFAAQIAQWGLVVLAAAGAWYFRADMIWVVIAWGLFALFMVAPGRMNRRALGYQSGGRWEEALRWRRLAGRLIWGRAGQLHRLFTEVLARGVRMDFVGAQRLLDDAASPALPAAAAGSLRLMRLYVAFLRQDWHAVILEGTHPNNWGSASNSKVAALMTARALAEAGAVVDAMRIVRDIAVRPGRHEEVAQSLWHTQLSVAALVGDSDELERLLSVTDDDPQFPGRDRVDAYWRGRCAAAKGEADRAMEYLEWARSLTPPGDSLWLTALDNAQAPCVPVDEPTRQRYRALRDEVREAEQTASRWMRLTGFMRAEPSTMTAIAVLAAVFVYERYVLDDTSRMLLWQWMANASETIVNGQWWRLITALFLHADITHLAMNALAFWVFGSALQPVIGRWRMWSIFLLGGAIGNLFSAALNVLQPAAERYDMAVGASSGIFALVGAYALAVASFREPSYTHVRRRAIVVLVFAVIADSMTWLIEPRIDVAAHLGGFCGGLLVAILLAAFAKHRR